ncbi:MAG: spore maturation protein [Lachnospiraceae bacterium]|nr:spore maturation protein [Lachnospiraceae bacterium]
MEYLVSASAGMIPAVILILTGYGVIKRVSVYDSFVRGAKQGLKTVTEVCPTLIGLMTGVGVLRAGGFLDFLAATLAPVAEMVHVPEPLVPVTIVRMFSSSAATGLILDLFEVYGPDSLIGFMASVSNSCTETVFYTMSVYFMAAGVKKTRWTLAGALLATAAGIAASVVLTYWMN